MSLCACVHVGMCASSMHAPTHAHALARARAHTHTHTHTHTGSGSTAAPVDAASAEFLRLYQEECRREQEARAAAEVSLSIHMCARTGGLSGAKCTVRELVVSVASSAWCLIQLAHTLVRPPPPPSPPLPTHTHTHTHSTHTHPHFLTHTQCTGWQAARAAGGDEAVANVAADEEEVPLARLFPLSLSPSLPLSLSPSLPLSLSLFLSFSLSLTLSLFLSLSLSL